MSGFDCKKFMKQEYSARKDTVSVPDLTAFFGKDEKPEWVVRGLTGNELARCNEAAENNKQLAQVVEALAGGNAKDAMEHMKQSMGMSDDVPAEVVKRMAMLEAGSVTPEINLEVAVKLNEYHPIEFFQLTNAITALTGAGAILGKPKNSGKDLT